MEKILNTKIEVLNIVSVVVAEDTTSCLTFREEASPLNILSDNCSPNLFLSAKTKFLGFNLPYIVDGRNNKFMFIRDIAKASGRAHTTVDGFFREADAMIKVGYRPKHYGGTPSKKRGLEHVNQNLVPLLHAMQYLRTRPEVKKRGVKKNVD
tara:strand:- start:38 stop:493 length:456 start_codon:yes stop_codon:yes gene_type:complete